MSEEERKRRIDDLKKRWAKIVSQGDQEQSAVDDWLNNASSDHRGAVADYLDQDFDDPVMESVALLASLALSQAVVRNTIALNEEQS